MGKAIVIDPKDNVATALSEISSGEVVEIKIGKIVKNIQAKNTIPFGHKLAIKRIEKGEAIGKATRTIEEGEHAHIHNIESTRGR
ncbi:MAG: UxaA family hydrolase [Candidatus Bathyarchaeia archaeon]